MQFELNIDAIITAVLAHDAEPPDEDYTPVAHGATLATAICTTRHNEFIAKVLRCVPASLASSLLEGFFENATCDANLLLDEIAAGHSVDTSGTIVSLLVGLGCSPDEVEDELFGRLKNIHEHATQDRYSFALWILYCGETVLIAEGKSVVFLVTPQATEIYKQLNRDDLSDYSRLMLNNCLARITPSSDNRA